ncbi:MAG: bamA [Stenotrophomonas indicatrix]|nr:bamA [Stenotrophomonas indicatrix]
MTRLPNRRLLALALAAVTGAPALAQAAEPFTVSDIRVDGLQRISSGTVFTYLPVERGETVTDSKVGETIRALYKTGFFEDVQLDRQGSILVVTVKERPAINKLTVTGNKDIKSDQLLKGLSDIGLTEGGTFDRLSLDRVTQELRRQYNDRGKYTVDITPTVSPLDRNRVDIAIAIKEGKAAKIRHVNIVGTEKYDSKDILEYWESKEHNWASWYRRDDQYSKEKLSGDLEKLNSWYLDRGYVDFSIDSTQVSISPDKRDMFITAGVTEGDQYKISEIKVSGDTILPQEDVERMVVQKSGDTFSRALLEFSSDSITNSLSNIGYAFAKVNPIPTTNRAEQTVAVNMQVVPGPRVTVRRIIFKGNTRTSDEVMRREMRQFENSWYSQAAIDRSKIRLQRLGYFEAVEVETPPVSGSNDQVDVVYNVKETTSGSFVFGLGYSQSYGMTTSVQLSQNVLARTGLLRLQHRAVQQHQRFGTGGIRRADHRDRHRLADVRHRQQPDHHVRGLDPAVHHRLHQCDRAPHVPLLAHRAGLGPRLAQRLLHADPRYLPARGPGNHAARLDRRVLQAQLPDQQILADHPLAGHQHPRGSWLRRQLWQ